jgi:elongation factor Ts
MKEKIVELRERTGAGMLACKKALEATSGDIDAAAKDLLSAGAAKADKRSSKIASEGMVALSVAADEKQAVVLEINSETDFVARSDDFSNFVQSASKVMLENDLDSTESLSAFETDGKTLEVARQELVVRIGENIQLRRATNMKSDFTLGHYLHGGRIAVLIALDVENKDLARDIAMHVAASNPIVIKAEDISSDIIAREHEIYTNQAQNSGKSEDIIEKMVQGKLAKFKKENALLSQPFVKDTEKTIAQYLQVHSANVVAMVRYELGEGIEKEETDFSAEVMQQVEAARGKG